MTPYGRALSGQELATTRHVNAQPAPEGNVSGEDAFLFGALGDHLGPVQLGVSLLPSHLHFASGSFSDSRNLLMNADVEGAYRGHGWTAYGEAGRMPEIGSEGPRLYSREHWVSYESTRGVGIKVGRYMPAYGIHFADHTSLNRSDLGFDHVRPGVRRRSEPHNRSVAAPDLGVARPRRVHRERRRRDLVQYHGATPGGPRLECRRRGIGTLS